MTVTNTNVRLINGVSVEFGPDFSSEEDAMAISHLLESFIPEKNLTTDIEIHAAFIEYSVTRGSTVAPAIFTAFVNKFSIGQGVNNIHDVITRCQLDKDGIRLALRAYYLLWDSHPGYYRPLSLSKDRKLPGLFASAGIADIVAIFSGYYDDSCAPLDEIAWLYNAYFPLLNDYVSSISVFLKESQVALGHSGALDVAVGLLKSASAPATEYLNQISLSVLLFGLKQLMRLMVLYKTLEMSPGQLVDQFKAAVGHSHGLAIAAAFSMLTDNDSFYTVSKKVLGILLLAATATADSLDSLFCTAKDNGWVLDSRDMRLPVHTIDGSRKIRDEPDLTKYLLKHVCAPCTDPVQASIDYSASHIVVFGSAKLTSLDRLVYKYAEGTGISVIQANMPLPDPDYPYMGTAADLYRSRIEDIPASPAWRLRFAPALVKTSFDGKLHMDTRVHRLFGKPPVTVIGKLQLKQIADVYNAGYHVEIDGSDLGSEAAIMQTFMGLLGLLMPGQGITINYSYSDRDLWSIQIPAIVQLCKGGLPVAGICFGGAVPQPEVALGVVGQLAAVGVRHVSFKPNDKDEILQIVRIAHASQGFPILLQWTRSKAGEPFSFDRFVRPLLETYGAVRSCDNLALAVETSDITSPNDVLSYVTGEWSSKYGRALMPVDGILVDSSSFAQDSCADSGLAIAGTLDTIYRNITASVLELAYASDENRVPTVEYIGNDPRKVALPDNVQLESSATEQVFRLPTDTSLLPEHDAWLEVLGGDRKSWIQQLLSTPVVIQGIRCVPNPIKQVMRPMPGQTVTLSIADGVVNCVNVTSGSDNTPCATIKHCKESNDISVAVYYGSNGKTYDFTVEYVYHPEQPFAPMRQYMDRLQAAVRKQQLEVWKPLYGVYDVPETTTGFDEVFNSDEPVVTKQRIRDFCQSVNSSVEYYSNGGSDAQWNLPIEFAYFLNFPGICRIFALPEVGNYHFLLFPLYHKIENFGEVGQFCSDAKLKLTHSVDDLFNTTAGRQIAFTSVVHYNGKPVARTSNAFLAVGGAMDNAKAYSKIPNQIVFVRLPARENVQSLEGQEWFSYISDNSPRVAPGSLVEFCLDSVCRFQDAGVYSSIVTTGSAVVLGASGRRTCVASINLKTDTPCTSNPVVEFLQQYAASHGSCVFANGGCPMDLPGLTESNPHITVPGSLEEFATISSDYNPVHVNHYYAGLYMLPSTVAHAIWVGTATRAVIDKQILEGDVGRVRKLDIKPAGPAFLNDKLAVSVRHTGMSEGLIQAQAVTTKLDGTPVTICNLGIEQKRTAYVFTGHSDAPPAQTGMKLYDESTSAKEVWDCAHRYMLQMYGVPLLDIVRDVPTSLEIRFKGNPESIVLEKYVSLREDCLQTGLCVLPGFSADNQQSYTFRSSGGLLNLLQFSQLVHCVDAMANISDMRSKGLVQKNALFAGHSLGEIAALASLGCGLLSVEETVEIAFCLGLLMQSDIDNECSSQIDAAQPDSVSSLLHSDKILPHVDTIRSMLQKYIHASNVSVSALQHCYIPNLTGKPFELSKSYIETAFQITQSAVLKRIIDGWPSLDLDNALEEKRIAAQMLIELLVFQMANPVQWNCTLQHMLKEKNIRRLIEISSISQPLSSEILTSDNACHLHIIRDRDSVYYEQN
ncbi:fatty acid synthase alpha subunit Lsd1 [Coemansia sp. RSA 1933]|nr:fatty acid synthase alpha subunit Lsd1 [Coemansia sp. RSA 1933]